MSDYPSDWTTTQLQSVAKDFIVPMRDRPKRFTGSIPWIRIEDFTGKWVSRSQSGLCVDDEIIQEMNLKVHPQGSVLCSCSARLGVCAITERPLITNQTFIGIVPDITKIAPEYLYYLMCSKATQLQALSSGTTIAYLPRQKFEEFEISIPPLPEQKKIAEILSGIDTEIMLLDAKISKLNLAKSSVSEKEFDHATFLQTETSSSENSLQKKILREVADVIDCKHRTPAYTSEGFPVVRPRDVKGSGINFDQCIKTSAEELDSLNDGINPQINDIVYSRNATLGVGALVRNKTTFAIGQDVCILRSKAINPKYFYYQLNSASFFRQVEGLVSGSTFKRINLGAIRELQVTTPDTSEQARVASTLEGIDNSIASLQRRREKNTQLKTSLAQDLLLGRKRVSI